MKRLSDEMQKSFHAAIEKKLADQKAEIRRLQKRCADLEEHFFSVRREIEGEYPGDAKLYVNRICTLILKERRKGADDGQE